MASGATVQKHLPCYKVCQQRFVTASCCVEEEVNDWTKSITKPHRSEEHTTDHLLFKAPILPKVEEAYQYTPSACQKATSKGWNRVLQ